MQPKKYAKLASKGVRTLGLTLASSCLIYSGTQAAELGKLTVLSSLGQPLRAEIELTSVTKEEIGNLVPKLASFDAFRQANVDYSHSLMLLRFAIEDRGSRHYILITSKQVIDEPFLGVLVELSSPDGTLVREYSMLLDPVAQRAINAVTSAGRSAGSSAVAISKMPDNTTTAPASSGTSSAADSATNVLAKSVTSEKSNRSGRDEDEKSNTYYQIKSGDNLRKIAIHFQHPGVSLDQMLVALQRSNPSSIINGNMNLIRSGRILTIPGKSEASRVSQSEAKKIVIAQSVDFNAYRNKLANQVTQAKAEKLVAANKTEGGKITAKIIEAPTPVSESKDKLTLSKAQLEEKQVQDEDKIAKQKALEVANARLKELEQNTANLQKMLELKSKVATGSTPAQALTSPATSTTNTELTTSSSSSVSSSNSTALSALDSTLSTSLPAPKLKVPAENVAQPTGQTAASTDNWMRYLPYGAAILALLGLAGIYLSKRKKKVEQFDDESILTESAEKDNSLIGSAGGQSIDTNNNSVFNSNFVPSASQLDANEVDPIAEADVYIAYGRDEQAEEILKEALRTQPDRQAIRVKMLEIYVHRKDIRAFETVASELYGLTGGNGPDWAQAASMGITIDPKNPLYAGTQATEDIADTLNNVTLDISTPPLEITASEILQESLIPQRSLDSTPSIQDSGYLDKTNLSNDELDFDLKLTPTANVHSDLKHESSSDHKLVNDNETVSRYQGQADERNAPMVAEQALVEKPQEDNQTISETNSIMPSRNANANANASVVENGMDFAALNFELDNIKIEAEEAAPVEAVATGVEESTSESGSALVQNVQGLGAQNAPDENRQNQGMQDEGIGRASQIPKDGSSKPFEVPSLETKAPTLDVAPVPEKKGLPNVEQVTAPFDFDLSGIDLDLPKESAEDQRTKTDVLESDGVVKAHAVETESTEEISTKLELAAAYQEIGDKDGARELLDEVIIAGNQEQISRAKAMMLELAR